MRSLRNNPHGVVHVVLPLGGSALNNPKRMDLPTPDRLKPEFHTEFCLSLSLRSLRSLRPNQEKELATENTKIAKRERGMEGQSTKDQTPGRAALPRSQNIKAAQQRRPTSVASHVVLLNTEHQMHHTEYPIVRGSVRCSSLTTCNRLLTADYRPLTTAIYETA